MNQWQTRVPTLFFILCVSRAIQIFEPLHWPNVLISFIHNCFSKPLTVPGYWINNEELIYDFLFQIFMQANMTSGLITLNPDFLLFSNTNCKRWQNGQVKHLLKLCVFFSDVIVSIPSGIKFNGNLLKRLNSITILM